MNSNLTTQARQRPLRSFFDEMFQDMFSPLVGATVATLGGRVTDIFSGPQFQENRSIVIWKKLHAHERTPSTEFPRASSSAKLPGPDFWGIPENPTMNVLVTDGLMLRDEGDPGVRLTAQGPYDACSCGSGLKCKFCCRGLETWRPTLRQ